MLLAFAQPILADIGELLVGLVALIFLVLRGLLEANKQAGPQRARPPVPPPVPPQPPVKGAVPAAGQQADPLRAQVEEFLRRAARPPQPAPKSEIEVLIDPSRAAEQRVFGEPLRQAEWRKTPQTAQATSAQPITLPDRPRPARSAAKPRRRQSVAEHVAEQVTARSRNLADKASQLGQRIVAEDQQFDVQLKAKFDHTVGTLAGTTMPASAEQTAPPSDTPAAQLASLLANPNGIRQAVLINEILRRPSERW